MLLLSINIQSKFIVIIYKTCSFINQILFTKADFETQLFSAFLFKIYATYTDWVAEPN